MQIYSKFYLSFMSEILISGASLLKMFALKHNTFEKSQHFILQLILYMTVHFKSVYSASIFLPIGISLHVISAASSALDVKWF